MGMKFFKSKKNIITFTIAACLALAIIVTVVALLVVKAPKAEFVSAKAGDYIVYYDKNGVDMNLTIKEYDGNCENLKITVPEKMTIDGKTYTVAKIGNKAFSGESNSKLKDLILLELPKTIIEIGDNAFESTTSLTELTIKGQVNKFGSEILKNSGVKDLTIENLTAGYNLKSFAETTFNKIIIKNIVGNIEDFKAEYASGINAKALYLGEDVANATMLRPLIQKVETLSYYVNTELFSENFLTTSKITTLYINGVGKSIETEETLNIATQAKNSVKNIYLDETCDTIGQNAFNGFVSLENVYIYETDMTISLDALGGANTNAKICFVSDKNINLTIKSGTTTAITSAFMSSFENIDQINSVVIANGVTSIKSGAFNSAVNLTQMSFKSNSTVTEIETGAFGSLQINFTGPTADSNHYVYNRLNSYDFASNKKSYNA